ncbi:hypothetical protein, partial [Plasmodium yoelii yoelii]
NTITKIQLNMNQININEVILNYQYF